MKKSRKGGKRPSTTPEKRRRSKHQTTKKKSKETTEVTTTSSLSVNQELLNDPNAPETREIYKQLIKLNFRYIQQRNIPKSPRTFYVDSNEETEGQKYLRQIREKNEKKSKKKKKKARKVEDKVTEEKVARLQQKIIVKKTEKEDIRQLRVATPPITANRPAIKRKGLKAYTGDRFGTRGDYSKGMLYLSRLALPADSAAAKKQAKIKRETVVIDPADLIDFDEGEESDEDEDFDEFELKNMESKRKAATAIMELAKNNAIRAYVVRDGGIKAITSLVGYEDEHLRSICATTLFVLSQQEETHEKMIEDDGIEALVTLLESEVQQTTYMASVALANLACCSGNEMHILEAGTIASLQAIRNQHRATTDQLARLLLNLSCADDSMHIGGEEVIESVFSLANSETESIRDLCLRALCRMSLTPSNRFHLASKGAVRLISEMMRFEKSNNALMNYTLVMYLLSADKHARHKLMEQNVVDICIKLATLALENKDFKSLSLSVATLANMSLFAPCREHLFDEGAVNQVVEWSKLDDINVQKSCAQTLQCMASDDDCVQRSVEEGALKALIGLCQSKIDAVVRTSCFSLALLLSRANAGTINFNELNESTALLLRLMAQFAQQIKEKEEAERIAKEQAELAKDKSLGRRRHSAIIDKNQLLKAQLNTTAKANEDLSGPSDSQMTIVCAIALCNLSAQKECRDTLVKQGAPKVLIFLIHHGDTDTVKKCAQTMYYLSTNKANHVGLIDGGAVPLAIEVMRGHPVTDVVWYCGAMMFALAGEKKARNGIISQDGALMALLEMSNSGNADVRILCGAIICRLSSEVDRSEEIVQAGAVPSLITLSNWTHFPTRQRCIVSISNLARGRLRARIIAEGAVPALIALSSSKDRKMRQDCASALCNLSCSAVSEIEMVKQGALSALIVLGLIRSYEDPLTKKTCGKALFNLLCSDEAIEYAVEEDVIWALNEMCEMDEETGDMFAVAACNLSRYERSRRQLLRPGPIESLLDLISTGAEDVKIASGLALQNIICFATEDQLSILGSTSLIRHLTNLSKIRDEGTKEACASALCAFSLNKKCRMHFLDGGGLEAMLELSKIGEAKISGYCTATLYALAKDERTRMKSVKRGAMALLVQLSVSPKITTKEHCARILYLLVLSKDARGTLASKGAVKITIGLSGIKFKRQKEGGVGFVIENSNPLIHSLCARILCLLSCSIEAVQPMVESNAVRILGLLSEILRGDERVRQDCVVALSNLSAHSNSHRMTMDGATHTLCELCDLKNVRSMERIAVVFRNLSCHQANARRMVEAGVVPTLDAISKRGNPDTIRHCLVALCNLSFAKDDLPGASVRQKMAEEGAATCVMRLSRILDTVEAFQFCGLSISNLASDRNAHQLLVEAGAINLLMEWLDRQTNKPKSKKKKNGEDNYYQEDLNDDADKILIKARHRIEVPTVEEAKDLPKVNVSFIEPHVEFSAKSLPWRKFTVELTPNEPNPPNLPNVERPIVKKIPGANISDEDCTTDLAVGMGDENHSYERILMPELDAELVKELKAKDSGTWAKHTPIKVKSKGRGASDIDEDRKKSFNKSKSFLGFDISADNSELVADDRTDPFPEGENAKISKRKISKEKKDEEKSDSSNNFGILMKRPSSLPDAPNFVEHLDSLLDSGIVTGIVDDGKPKMWK